MKRIFILCSILLLAFVVGCQKNGENEIINDLSKKINNASSYQLTGQLEITNNDDTYDYDVKVSYEKPNNYRVSLINQSNDHEQIILKNDDGVFVDAHKSLTFKKLNI